MVMKVLLLVSVVCLFHVAFTENLEYKKVWLIDYNKFQDGTINYLYRGNAPIINNTQFAYNELIQYMTSRANDSMLPFPSKFYFIDISLDNTFDGEDFTVEREWWAVKGATEQFGIMLHWPITETAGIIPPQIAPPNYRKEICNSSDLWLIDQIPTRIDYTHQILLTERYDKLPVVIYVHCVGGCDRTGEFIATYRLQYSENKNITDIYAKDIQECGRCPNELATSSIEWFCICYKQQNARDKIGTCDNLESQCK
eukprot:213994_1